MAPPRPSRNLDRALLAAGRELLPLRGCAGLTVREVADVAGVNLGMFHYHFGSREAFLRTLLQSLYEEMFAELSRRAAPHPAGEAALASAEVLRAALRFMGRFLRENRPILARVIADALSGDAIATEFLARNMPRHLGLLASLVEAGRADGSLRDLPAAQLLGFCAGSLAAPILFGGAVLASGRLDPATARRVSADLLSDDALDQRVELALGAISRPRSRSPRQRAGAARSRAAR